MTTRKALKELRRLVACMRRNMENLRLFEDLADRASTLETFLISHGMENEVNELADTIWGS